DRGQRGARRRRREPGDPASEDSYRFTVADGNRVFVSPSSCPWNYGNKLAWTLVNDTTGATVGTGGCGNAETDPLPAGTYRLKVTPQDQVAGTYKMQVFTAPAPQQFDVALPASISNGTPAAGAGNLETPISEDDYRFTVPDGS